MIHYTEASMQQLTEFPYTSLQKGKPTERCMGLMCKVAQAGVCQAQVKQVIARLWSRKSFLAKLVTSDHKSLFWMAMTRIILWSYSKLPVR